MEIYRYAKPAAIHDAASHARIRRVWVTSRKAVGANIRRGTQFLSASGGWRHLMHFQQFHRLPTAPQAGF
ncbi:hypothetical protein PC116_g2687 [Phytophthora cactorum]|nr:hypothetical protein PC116_g2687 [Phytophthora cactorum]